VSRRSPTNERYQKFTEPKGKTRKSAAAAKPSRLAGSAPEKSKPSSKAKPSTASKYVEPQTPEYKFWRRIWWASLLTGIVLVLISLAIQYLLRLSTGPFAVVSAVCVALSYVGLLVAFLVEYFRLRPIRKGTYTPKSTAEKVSQLDAAHSADTRATSDPGVTNLGDSNDPADISNHQ
jgi:hypothetical protein